MPPRAAAPKSRWTAEADQRMLILALTISDFKPSMATWKAVADEMGDGLTANAIHHRFRNLKKSVESSTALTTDDKTPPTPPAKPTQKAPTSQQKRKAAMIEEGDGQHTDRTSDNEEEPSVVSKKTKSEETKATIKTEGGETDSEK